MDQLRNDSQRKAESKARARAPIAGHLGSSKSLNQNHLSSSSRAMRHAATKEAPLAYLARQSKAHRFAFAFGVLGSNIGLLGSFVRGARLLSKLRCVRLRALYMLMSFFFFALGLFGAVARRPSLRFVIRHL